MSIESSRDYDTLQYTITCDMPDCNESEWIDADHIKDANIYFREVGWMITLVGGEWKHYCPNCKDFNKFTRRPVR